MKTIIAKYDEYGYTVYAVNGRKVSVIYSAGNVGPRSTKMIAPTESNALSLFAIKENAKRKARRMAFLRKEKYVGTIKR